MGNLFKIAFRNLKRYKRRTLLTASLITLGVVFVLLFISVTGSFKNMMIGQMTDSMLGHLQVHRKGYLASIDNLPLNMNLRLPDYKKLEEILNQQPEIEAYSPRIKFGGMFSKIRKTGSTPFIMGRMEIRKIYSLKEVPHDLRSYRLSQKVFPSRGHE